MLQTAPASDHAGAVAPPPVTDDMPDEALIDAGKACAGSQAKLARAIGYSDRVVSNGHARRKALSPEARRRLLLYVRTGQTFAANAGARRFYERFQLKERFLTLEKRLD